MGKIKLNVSKEIQDALEEPMEGGLSNEAADRISILSEEFLKAARNDGHTTTTLCRITRLSRTRVFGRCRELGIALHATPPPESPVGRTEAKRIALDESLHKRLPFPE